MDCEEKWPFPDTHAHGATKGIQKGKKGMEKKNHVWNLHRGSSSPSHSSSPTPTNLSSLSPLSRLSFSLFSTIHKIPTINTFATKYPIAKPCPKKYLGPSLLRYSWVPITAPRFPILICIALLVARFVCPDTLLAGHERTMAVAG